MVFSAVSVTCIVLRALPEVPATQKPRPQPQPFRSRALYISLCSLKARLSSFHLSLLAASPGPPADMFRTVWSSLEGAAHPSEATAATPESSAKTVWFPHRLAAAQAGLAGGSWVGLLVSWDIAGACFRATPPPHLAAGPRCTSEMVLRQLGLLAFQNPHATSCPGQDLTFAILDCLRIAAL